MERVWLKESLIWFKEKFTSNDIQKEDLGKILVKLHYRELSDSKLPGLCDDNMATSISPKIGPNQIPIIEVIMNKPINIIYTVYKKM